MILFTIKTIFYEMIKNIFSIVDFIGKIEIKI